VVATGFSADRVGQMDAFEASDGTRAYAPKEKEGAAATPTFDSEDLDIPAFLRNRR
jgi:hypothetical protein